MSVWKKTSYFSSTRIFTSAENNFRRFKKNSQFFEFLHFLRHFERLKIIRNNLIVKTLRNFKKYYKKNFRKTRKRVFRKYFLISQWCAKICTNAEKISGNFWGVYDVPISNFKQTFRKFWEIFPLWRKYFQKVYKISLDFRVFEFYEKFWRIENDPKKSDWENVRKFQKTLWEIF